jgi:polyhydroxyalkanoate synthesis repressor PhaR
MAEPRIIRKYANRRLYDATTSRHVTLEDIRRLIAAGENVKVVDDPTGADLTRVTMLQIIAEQEQYGRPVLSSKVLEAIIRFYGNPVQELLVRYLETGATAVMRQQQLIEEQLKQAVEGPLAPLAELARQNLDLWTRMQESMGGSARGRGRPDTDRAEAPAPSAGGAPEGPSSRKPRKSRKSRKPRGA